jgi:hypothetical protein
MTAKYSIGREKGSEIWEDRDAPSHQPREAKKIAGR